MNVSRIRTTDYAIVGIILVIAMLVRIFKLNSSLSFDEIVTLVEFVRLPTEDLLFGNFAFNNHPFYSLQAKASVLLFGESNWSVRLPAVFFGIASIAVIWRLAYQITGSLQAHVCALLLALSYHHVWFSQNARGYTGLMFWGVVSTLMLIDCLRSPSWGKWIVYGLVIAAGILTHLTAAFFFLAQAIIVGVVLLKRNQAYPALECASKRGRRLMPAFGFLTAGIVALLFYSPSLVHVFELVLDVSNSSSMDVMKEYQSPVWAALEIVRSFARPGPATSIVIVIAAFVTAVGMYSIFRIEPLLPAVVMLHITITLVALVALSMRIWPRFFFIDMGFVLLFVTQGVWVCCRQIAIFMKKSSKLDFTKESLFIFSSALMLAVSGTLLVRNYQFPKQDFDASFNYVTSQKSGRDKVVTLGWAAYPYQNYYAMHWPAVESQEELRKIEGEAAATWLLIIFPTRTTRKYEEIINYVNENYSLAKTFKGTLGDGNILVFKKNPQG